MSNHARLTLTEVPQQIQKNFVDGCASSLGTSRPRRVGSATRRFAEATPRPDVKESQPLLTQPR
jgi:hypothetical protein